MWRVGCRCLRRTLWVSCRGWSSVLNYEIKLIFKAVVNWMRLNPERYTLFVDSKTFSSIHLLNIAIIIIVHAQLYSQSNSTCYYLTCWLLESLFCVFERMIGFDVLVVAWRWLWLCGYYNQFCTVWWAILTIKFATFFVWPRDSPSRWLKGLNQHQSNWQWTWWCGDFLTSTKFNIYCW